jgi:hypothetical protein
VTDEEIMAALRQVPPDLIDESVSEHFLNLDPGADSWRVYEIVATGYWLVFTFNGELTMSCIRRMFEKHIASLPTVGGMQ